MVTTFHLNLSYTFRLGRYALQWPLRLNHDLYTFQVCHKELPTPSKYATKNYLHYWALAETGWLEYSANIASHTSYTIASLWKALVVPTGSGVPESV